MKHRKIRTLEDLRVAVSARRAVFVPGYSVWKNPRPAAFVINMSGTMILRMIRKGMFLYEKESSE